MHRSCRLYWVFAHRTFDNTGKQAVFGCVSVDYGMVQNKVNVKYDAWHKDIVAQFGARLGTSMADLHAALRKARVHTCTAL